MKFLLSAGFIALSINAANAGPGTSRMPASEIKDISKSISRTYSRFGGFRMNKEFYGIYPHIQRRTFCTKLKTKGYEPKETPVVPHFYTLNWPRKLEYVDETHEVFRTPPGFREMLEEAIKRERRERSSVMKDEK